MRTLPHFLIAALSVPLGLSSLHAQQSAEGGPAITLPRVDPAELKPLAEAYPTPNKPDRITFVAPKTQRGNTTPIPEDAVVKFCSGKDGCIIRIGMHNWDDTGRVASRHFLFFYNKENGVWRSDLGDAQGTNKNNVTEHINHSWSCYFTDGRYENWQDKGDTDGTFGLLSWNEYNADCYLTIVN